MDILNTLLFLKNDIKVAIWNEDPIKAGLVYDLKIGDKYVVYNETETSRFTLDDLNKVNPSDVATFVANQKTDTLTDLQVQLTALQQQITDLQGK